MTDTSEQTAAPQELPPGAPEAADPSAPEPTLEAEPTEPDEAPTSEEAPAAVTPAPETTPVVADAPATESPAPVDAPAAEQLLLDESPAPEILTESPAPEVLDESPAPEMPAPETSPTLDDALASEQPLDTEGPEPSAPEDAAVAVTPGTEAASSVADGLVAEQQVSTQAPETPTVGVAPGAEVQVATEAPAAEEPVAEAAAPEATPAVVDAPAPDRPATPTPGSVPTPRAVASVVHEHPTPLAPVETAAATATDHAAWGRVDEQGTVWVRASSGERAVGSYPGTTPDEALAYFARKFEETEGQVTLLEQRVAAGGVSPKDADTSISNLRESITAAHAVGDLDTLGARLDALVLLVVEQRKNADIVRSAARREALVVKERIVAEAESLGTSTDWKRTGDRLRGLLDEWKEAARLDRKTDDALWKRFSHARTAFDKHRRAHFAELDTQRASAAEAKEKLIAQAEELSTSTEWVPTARRYRDLMAEWKAVGRARRDVEDELWGRFRAAQDTFFAARNEVVSARDADLAVNLEKKKALLVEAERLLPITDVRSARSALLSIHDRWEDAGHVPRNDKDAVEGRLRKVDEAVRSAEDAKWKGSNPEARARAEATVGQLRSSIQSLDEEAEKATAAGEPEKAAKAQEAAAARREWLAEAERTLAEFS